MQIYVKLPDNKTIRFDVEAHYTINNAKALVRYKEGIPTNQQRLIFETTQLEDGCKLSDYGLVEGAILKNSFKLKVLRLKFYFKVIFFML